MAAVRSTPDWSRCGGAPYGKFSCKIQHSRNKFTSTRSPAKFFNDGWFPLALVPTRGLKMTTKPESNRSSQSGMPIQDSGALLRINKVPEVTALFWLIKIMSTTVGETGADYLAVHVGLGTAITGGIMVTLLAAALLLQFRSRRYVPWIYSLTVVLVSGVGTQLTDLLTDRLDVSLYVSTAVFAGMLAATFAVWYWMERTLSIQPIVTTRRELFYWAAILFTFALGTAAGDLATEALGLGFKLGVVVFGILIAMIFGAYYLGANTVLTFWLAYILTRPLGASLGDLLSQARGYGGIGLGSTLTSIVFLVVIVVVVTILELDRHANGRNQPA